MHTERGCYRLPGYQITTRGSLSGGPTRALCREVESVPPKRSGSVFFQGGKGSSMSAYSATLSEETITAAKRAFNRYDYDNSGTVSVDVRDMSPVLLL